MRTVSRLALSLFVPVALAVLTGGCKANAPAAAPPAVAPTTAATTSAPAAPAASAVSSAPNTVDAKPSAAGPIVKMVTVRGTILIKLFPKDAPISCANFEKLINKGFYNGLTFHRITDLDPSTPSKIVQGGDPHGDGSGGPGYTIKGEFSANGVNNPLTHVAGAFAMARTGQDPNPADNDPNGYNTAGSQFYICVNPVHFLDGNYAVFGQVIKGLDVADKLQVGDKMTSVTLEK